LDLVNEFSCFPVILLDKVAVIWATKGVTMCCIPRERALHIFGL